MITDFSKFAAATSTLDGPERLRVFDYLSADAQASCWQRLSESLEGERVLDGLTTARRRSRRSSSAPARPRPAGSGRRHADDPLLRIDPPVYVEVLTGQPVIGGRALCPWHDDRNPSLVVYPTADRGVYCFACDHGGSIYDVAGRVLGLETRGEDFKRLRRRIAERLLNTGVAA